MQRLYPPPDRRTRIPRRLWQAAGCVFATGLTFLVIFYLGLFSRPTRASFDRVQLGMSRWEVIRIFRSLPGNYSSRPEIECMTIADGGWSAHWHGDDGDFLIHFGSHSECVAAKLFRIPNGGWQTSAESWSLPNQP